MRQPDSSCLETKTWFFTVTVRQPPFSQPLCTAGVKRTLDRILTSDQHRSTEWAVKTKRCVLLYVVVVTVKSKAFQIRAFSAMSTPQVVRCTSISIFYLWEQSHCLSDVSVSVCLGNFTVEKVRFISICFHPEIGAFFRIYLKAVFQRMGNHSFTSASFSNQILKRKTQLSI